MPKIVKKTEIQAATLGDLHQDPQNARKHNPRNIGMIESSLRQVGAARSGVIDEDGMILAGNGTYDALTAAGINKVKIVEANGEEWVVVRRKGLTAEQKRALAIADNRAAELAEWDGPALAAQGIDLAAWFNEGELAKIGAGSPTEPITGPDPRLDEAKALRKRYGVNVGQVWALGAHRLMCGDSTKAKDVDRLLHGAKPFLMVTDPPYGVDYEPEWRQEAAASGHLSKARRAVGKVTADDQVDWTDAYNRFTGPVAYVWHVSVKLDVGLNLREAGFEIRSQIIWRKPIFAISRGHYHWQHEAAWYAVRKGESAKWCGDRSQSTVWEISNQQPGHTNHGTQKPVECMARPIRNHGAKDDDVYDPFLGSGTTLIACEQLKRRCYAMEISPAYVAVAIQRWVDLTGKEPKLENARTRTRTPKNTDKAAPPSRQPRQAAAER